MPKITRQVATRLPVDLLAHAEAWMAQQVVPPTLTGVIERALSDFLTTYAADVVVEKAAQRGTRPAAKRMGPTPFLEDRQ